MFSSNLKEMTESTYYPKSHILLGSIFFLDFRGSEPWQCSGLFLAPCKSFKVDVVCHWTDECMDLFQSFKVEVFIHWTDEYIALFQSFKVEVYQICNCA